MRKFSTEAVVLKHREYKDSHRLYTLVTPDHGKFVAVARGVRKISSRRSGNLDSLNHIKASISEDSKKYYSIEEVKTVASHSKVKSDFQTLSVAMYLADLVDILLAENQESFNIYHLFVNALSVINNKTTDLKLLINVFEMRLLNLLGFGLSLDKCVVCGENFNNSWSRIKINPELGGLICPNCKVSGQLIPFVTYELLTKTQVKFTGFTKGMYTPTDFKEADGVIKQHLSNVIDAYTKYPRVSKLLVDAVP